MLVQVGGFLNNVPRLLSALQGMPVEPVFVGIMDLQAPGRKGHLGRALGFLKLNGLRVAMNEGMIRTFGLDARDLAMEDQESAYLTDAEKRREGYAHIVSANMLGLTSARALYPTMFNKHHVFSKC